MIGLFLLKLSKDFLIVYLLLLLLKLH